MQHTLDLHRQLSHLLGAPLQPLHPEQSSIQQPLMSSAWHTSEPKSTRAWPPVGHGSHSRCTLQCQGLQQHTRHLQAQVLRDEALLHRVFQNWCAAGSCNTHLPFLATQRASLSSQLLAIKNKQAPAKGCAPALCAWSANCHKGPGEACPPPLHSCGQAQAAVRQWPACASAVRLPSSSHMGWCPTPQQHYNHAM